jgi:hypothetical protein
VSIVAEPAHVPVRRELAYGQVVADTKLVKLAGEHWVCSVSARHGWGAALTRDGLEHADILGVHSSTRRLVEVQVKTASFMPKRLAAEPEGPGTVEERPRVLRSSSPPTVPRRGGRGVRRTARSRRCCRMDHARELAHRAWHRAGKTERRRRPGASWRHRLYGIFGALGTSPGAHLGGSRAPSSRLPRSGIERSGWPPASASVAETHG